MVSAGFRASFIGSCDACDVFENCRISCSFSQHVHLCAKHCILNQPKVRRMNEWMNELETLRHSFMLFQAAKKADSKYTHAWTGSAFRKCCIFGHVPQNSSPPPHPLPLHHDSSVSGSSNSTLIWAEALMKHVLQSSSGLVLPRPWYQRTPCRDDPPLVYCNRGMWHELIIVDWTVY